MLFPKHLLTLMILLTIGCALTSRAQPNPVIQNALAGVSPDSLLHTLTELSGAVPVVINGQQDTITTRQFNTPGNEKAFQYLKQRFTNYGLLVDSQQFSSTGKNLFGMLPGNDTTQFIVIGAHYDGVGGIKGPAADDNGSGVAAVLECTRLCRTVSSHPNIVFALWDEEETGSVGSTAYVQQRLGLPGKTFLGYINLDMIGWDGNNDGVAEVHTQYIASSLNWGTRVLGINTDYSIGLQMQLVNPGNWSTDVAPFWDAYLKAIGIAENYDADPCIYRHSVNDTAGALNLPYLRKTTQLALATLLESAMNQPAAAINALTAVTGHVSPNPFTHALELQFSPQNARIVHLLIVDAFGRKRFEQTVAAQSTLKVITEGWNAGIYQLAVYQDGYPVFQQRIVKAE